MTKELSPDACADDAIPVEDADGQRTLTEFDDGAGATTGSDVEELRERVDRLEESLSAQLEMVEDLVEMVEGNNASEPNCEEDTSTTSTPAEMRGYQ